MYYELYACMEVMAMSTRERYEDAYVVVYILYVYMMYVLIYNVYIFEKIYCKCYIYCICPDSLLCNTNQNIYTKYTSIYVC